LIPLFYFKKIFIELVFKNIEILITKKILRRI